MADALTQELLKEAKIVTAKPILSAMIPPDTLDMKTQPIEYFGSNGQFDPTALAKDCQTHLDSRSNGMHPGVTVALVNIHWPSNTQDMRNGFKALVFASNGGAREHKAVEQFVSELVPKSNVAVRLLPPDGHGSEERIVSFVVQELESKNAPMRQTQGNVKLVSTTPPTMSSANAIHQFDMKYPKAEKNMEALEKKVFCPLSIEYLKSINVKEVEKPDNNVAQKGKPPTYKR